jgi:hypothetical protein
MSYFSFQLLHPRKEEQPYFRVLNNKYIGDNSEEFKLLIVTVFVKIPRIIFKILNFEFVIS